MSFESSTIPLSDKLLVNMGQNKVCWQNESELTEMALYENENKVLVLGRGKIPNVCL